MAPIGGGPGGGGPVGSANSFTGSSSSIELVGDFCFVYPGLLQATDNSFHTVMEFTTGNYTVVGRFMITGAIDDDNFGQGKGAVGRISLNGSAQAMMRAGSGLASDSPAYAWQDFIIPPYTEVKGELGATETDSNAYTSMILTGTIYRG